MGTRMTFVTEEEGINVFLKSKEVNFELAVQKPVYRTGKEYFQIVCLNTALVQEQLWVTAPHSSTENDDSPYFML